MITYEDFAKVDIRAGEVLEVEDFPEARKPMYKITVDFGPEIGIKKSSGQFTQNYTKEELVGKTIIGVVNFPPKKIGPFFSEFLTLGLADEEDKVVLLMPTQKVPKGAEMC
ncbi:tRNA-binding protein [Candidatus Nomurabacteria bacterium RIFCSPLOWO2_01_FULL_41_12]|uniref:tRNA-binding protein n=1 Tax=Candidatus Nomurabacteria bacterium RIFCSPLOWO2_01_FULL_41_12 TaxID=1801774 RepID=A0A1F6WWD4_9BACT|nr:MAG: tRNA-binding protein [Candidatus Nomurabacteria bacterium RIFCSPHIGHO2_01_FULL_40_10]OGI86182.1 MAG: tRNA-binding protein [Candidatus Nomurabacteria bacterium RIFCSPLOWO2_01_FULL_41_12]